MDMSLCKLMALVMNREAGMLQYMGSQRSQNDWATELNWKIKIKISHLKIKTKQNKKKKQQK